MNPRPVQTLIEANINKMAAGSLHSIALLGKAKQISNLSHTQYLNSQPLINPFSIDMQKLSMNEGSNQTAKKLPKNY